MHLLKCIWCAELVESLVFNFWCDNSKVLTNFASSTDVDVDFKDNNRNNKYKYAYYLNKT